MAFVIFLFGAPEPVGVRSNNQTMIGPLHSPTAASRRYMRGENTPAHGFERPVAKGAALAEVIRVTSIHTGRVDA